MQPNSTAYYLTVTAHAVINDSTTSLKIQWGKLKFQIVEK
jgi:hypothetical protein